MPSRRGESRRPIDLPLEVTAEPDQVVAVLRAHDAGRAIALPTSGTSGRSRWVVRSTDSWWRSFAHVSARVGLDERSRLFVPGPLHASMNLFAAVHARACGADLVGSVGEATHVQATPSTLRRLLVDDGLRPGTHVTVAGDALTPGLAARAREHGLTVHHYYGAAELSFVAWGTHSGDLEPFPGVEVTAREGLLWVRSAYLCQGYAAGSGPLRRDRSGWASVGDRGDVAHGRVRVLGRGDEAVTTAGATVLVADVEARLRPGATGELVVLGVDHPHLGQVLAAVLTDPGEMNLLSSRARRLLEPAARPRRWYVADVLPVTGTGKTDREALGQAVSGGGLRRIG